MIDKIVDSLSLEEKALLMSGKTVWETFDIESKGIPSIFLSDGPHGLRKQEGASDHLGLNKSVPATCFPTAATIANSWDTTVAEEVGKCLGNEAKNNNVQVLLGPGLNIKRNPLCGRNFEYFSEDPYLSGKMAAAMIRGIQKNGTVACPKHFAVNNQELRRMASDSIVDEQTLREIYLTGFEIAVKEGHPRSIMSAYNKVNGVYANENEWLLRTVLRDEWGFDGFVVSDWGGSNDHVDGVRNSSHLEMPSTGYNGPMEIVQAVENNQLTMADLDERVKEILTVIMNIPRRSDEDTIDYEKHHTIAKEAAMRSIVLLKNEDQLLPINQTAKVGIIGDFASEPRYQGAGSSVVNAKNLEKTVDIMGNYPLNIIGFEKGFDRNGKENASLISEAVDLAKKADVVLLYVGLDELAESEGKDRDSISLSNNQLELIEALAKLDTKIVAVVSAGSVVDMSWEDKVDAILHGYLSGEAGAGAMLDVITGVYSPSGKLNETYPLAYSDIPFGEEYPSKAEQVLYKEGLFVGYRYYDKAKKQVRYPFGHGLSYSEFEYSDLTIKADKVTFNIKNSGNCYAEEVPQLYIGNPSEKVLHPVNELKGFTKIGIQANETKSVTIPFDAFSFRFYNSKTKQWEIETQTYSLRIGSSSRDIRLEGLLSVKGDSTELPYDPESLQSYFKGEISKVDQAEFEALLGYKLQEKPEKSTTILELNSTISDMASAKSLLARSVQRIISKMIAKAESSGAPNLNLLFIYNMPLRAIAKMTNGIMNMDMLDGILLMVNGKFFKGTGRLIGQSFSRISNTRNFKKRLGRD